MIWNSLCGLAMTAAVGGGPVYYGGPVVSEGPIAGDVSGDFCPGIPGPNGDQIYPNDAPMPWLHGHYQEIPAYGGYGSFQPYNYKHVLSQSQAAGGWGMPPAMPYSQQYWHAYQAQAAMAQRASEARYLEEMARLQAYEEYQSRMQQSAGESAQDQPAPAMTAPAFPQPPQEADRVIPTSGVMPAHQAAARQFQPTANSSQPPVWPHRRQTQAVSGAGRSRDAGQR